MAKEHCAGCHRLVSKKSLAPATVVTSTGSKRQVLCAQCRNKMNRGAAR